MDLDYYLFIHLSFNYFFFFLCLYIYSSTVTKLEIEYYQKLEQLSLLQESDIFINNSNKKINLQM